MNEFKKYELKVIIELREIEDTELTVQALEDNGIRIDFHDVHKGHPVKGDRIARDPEDHTELWLVTHDDFNNKYVRNNGTF